MSNFVEKMATLLEKGGYPEHAERFRKHHWAPIPPDLREEAKKLIESCSRGSAVCCVVNND